MTPAGDALDASWRRAWQSLGLTAPDGLRERLIAAYEEQQRRYHSLQHLCECIAQLDPVLALAVHPGEVEIALWFHDAVYDLKAGDNELRSAEWAVDELSRAGAGDAQRSRVHALVMATCHKAVPAEPDQQLLVDIDLAILGASPERFAEYDGQIRAEYSWVPGILYRMKRKDVLKSFLRRPAIYNTVYFRDALESRARANLEAAIR